MKNTISHKMRYPLNLLDIDRVLGFYAEAAQKFTRVRTYLRMNKGGFVLKDSARAKSMINKLGGFGELNYMEASSDDFLVTADFSGGELKISSKNKHIMDELLHLWSNYVTKIPASSKRDVLKLALLPQAKRFMLDCLGKDGRLSKTPKGDIVLNRDYLVPKLKELGMEYIINRYADFLLDIQNTDGGWGREPGLKSAILPTASAALILITAGKKEKLENAVNFICSRYEPDTRVWPSHEEPKLLTTALCALTLRRYYGKRNKIIKDSISCIKEELAEKWIQTFENDYITIFLLKDGQVRVRKLLDSLCAYLPSQDKNGGFPQGNPSITTTAIVLNALLDMRVKKSSKVIQRAVNFLINSRLPNGSWPYEMNSNSVYTTILALLALKKVNLVRV